MKSHLLIRSIPKMLLVLLMLLLIPSLSNALLYTYHYQGNHFTDVTSPYTTSNQISITMTSDHLMNMTGNPEPWGMCVYTISDGMNNVDWAFPSLASYFVSLASDGVPTEWIFSTDTVYRSDGSLAFSFDSRHVGKTSIDTAYTMIRDPSTGSRLDGTGRSSDPGVWTLTVTPDSAAIPEPSTIALVAGGLAGIATISFLKRKRAGIR